MTTRNQLLNGLAVFGLVVWQPAPVAKSKSGQAVDAEAGKEIVKVMELQPRTIARSVEYPATLDCL
jgi:hypothetical protein